MMRQKLRTLLERQQFNESLQAVDGIFEDFNALDKWLEHLHKNPSTEALEKIMKILEEFEARLRRVLEQQMAVSQQLDPLGNNPADQQIPLQSIMKELRQHLLNNDIGAAQELLNRLQENLAYQQSQASQKISQYYEAQMAMLNQKTQQFSQALEQVEALENQVLQMVGTGNLTGDEKPQTLVTDQVVKQQQEISAILSQATESFFPVMEPWVSTQSLETLANQAKNNSTAASTAFIGKKWQDGETFSKQVLADVQAMKNSLNTIQNQLQQLATSGRPMQQTGAGRYAGGKGVRRLKFEYQFEPDPVYRGNVQDYNQQKYRFITPSQRQYMEEVIK
ncbi:MAG: hypothetical protein HQM12_11430 [SAR324 cluster bacterium]|nr:hypothetical protein [SAR324 cluster bacterium]